MKTEIKETLDAMLAKKLPVVLYAAAKISFKGGTIAVSFYDVLDIAMSCTFTMSQNEDDLEKFADYVAVRVIDFEKKNKIEKPTNLEKIELLFQSIKQQRMEFKDTRTLATTVQLSEEHYAMIVEYNEKLFEDADLSPSFIREEKTGQLFGLEIIVPCSSCNQSPVVLGSPRRPDSVRTREQVFDDAKEIHGSFGLPADILGKEK